MTWKRFFLCLGAAGLSWLPFACSFDAGPDPDAPSGDIAAAKAVWHANEPGHYSYSVRMYCFCPLDTIRVTANRDSVLSAVPTRLGSDGQAHPVANPQAYSIDSLFARLEGMVASHPYKLHYRFDGRYGYPDSLDYDGSDRAEDDELTQTVFDFRIDAAP